VKSLGYFVFHYIYNLKSSKLFACLLACFITPLELHFALLKKEGKTAFGKKQWVHSQIFLQPSSDHSYLWPVL
jgi:hypothetical protein